jgi:hypothetical protein
MKILSLIFLSLFLGKGCGTAQKQDMESTVVEYIANTRGFYQKITIQNHKVSISRDRSGKATADESKISDAEWKELVVLFQDIKLEELPKLKSPTEKRFYDGAAIANLKVTYKGKIYESSNFDHGIPPAEIAKFVEKVNSFAKLE